MYPISLLYPDSVWMSLQDRRVLTDSRLVACSTEATHSLDHYAAFAVTKTVVGMMKRHGSQPFYNVCVPRASAHFFHPTPPSTLTLLTHSLPITHTVGCRGLHDSEATVRWLGSHT